MSKGCIKVELEEDIAVKCYSLEYAYGQLVIDMLIEKALEEHEL